MTDPHETARKLVEAGILEDGRATWMGTLVPGQPLYRGRSGASWIGERPSRVPDLSDPATCGVLMGMLMEACQSMTVITYHDGATRALATTINGRGISCALESTLGEALALALLEMKETTDE